jgi:cyclopropane fatty-acyl-phospholipid synthase-like methyltransferase
MICRINPKQRNIAMTAPPNPVDFFNRAYRLPITFWGDIRIPPELTSLIRQGTPRSSLELGCGIGRFTRYLAQQGLHATGVDFSPVAIAKARKRVAQDTVQPEFLVGDVTHLDALKGPFDITFDIGCFHCLASDAQKGYVSEVFRLLKPGSVHLIWAMDSAPSNIKLSPEAVQAIFIPGFRLQNARKSRRRLVRSHWYWLVRSLNNEQMK